MILVHVEVVKSIRNVVVNKEYLDANFTNKNQIKKKQEHYL